METLLLSLKHVFVDFFAGLFRFPLWWYGQGLARFGKGLIKSIDNYRDTLSVDVWIRNLFVPMYGSYDIAGRIISFIVRSFQIVVRSIALVIFIILHIGLFGLYIAAPIFVGLQIAYHFVGVIIA